MKTENVVQPVVQKYSDYSLDKSCLGNVYIPSEGVEITGPIRIRYEKHPWIEQFELDGIRPAKDRRKGYGNKDFKGFVQSLNSIYPRAYEEYEELGEGGLNADAYFAHVAECFCEELKSDKHMEKLFRMFCGYVENMWREGNREMHDVALEVVLPIIEAESGARDIFYNHITDEFNNYIKEKGYGKQG